MEGAGEAGLERAAALNDLDAAVPARVLKGRHLVAGGARHDDGLVQDLVFGEVTDAGDLLEPARHLPDPGPEQVSLHFEEVSVVVALFGDPVGDLDPVGDAEG